MLSEAVTYPSDCLYVQCVYIITST